MQPSRPGWTGAGRPCCSFFWCWWPAWHSQLGVRVVVEDYVHAPGARTVTLAVLGFLHALLAAAGVFAVLKVALGGGA